MAEARNGREAVELFEQLRPDVVFLDVHMPGCNGVDAARAIGPSAQIVFVTAFEQYAVQAFEQGAIDYVVKPLDEARLAATVARLKEPARRARGASGRRRAARRGARATGAPTAAATATLPRLQWISASVGSTVKLIPVEQVAYLRSDEKYTLVVWDGGEALIRKPIRELIDELDPEQLRAGASLGDRQPEAGGAGDARAERNRRGAPARPQRDAAGQPQLPAPVPADVGLRALRAPGWFHSHAAPRTPDESPCRLCTRRVRTGSSRTPPADTQLGNSFGTLV